MADLFDELEINPKGKAATPGKDLFDELQIKPPEPGGFVASAKQSVGSLIKGAGQAAADFIPGVSQGNAVQRYGQSVIDANPTAVHSLGDIADKPGMAVREAAGNATGSIGGMVGARVLGNAITAAAPLTGPLAPATAAVGQGVAWLGPWAAAALPSFGGIREQQVKDDPSKQGSISAKALAAAGAGTVGLIERFGPQEWALKALTKEGRAKLAEKFAANSVAGSIGKGVARGAAVEGAEELAQNPVEQLAAYQDPTTAENVQDTLFGGAMGFLGGGVFGGGVGAASRVMGGENSKAAQQADPAATQEAPTLALPAPPPSTGTPDAQVSQAEADRADQVAQAEANAAEIYRQRDAFDAARQANQAAAPLPFTTQPAEELAAQRKAAMGIDPSAGPLSAGAAIAVESQAAEDVRLGAASVLAEGAARALQAQAERAAWEAANPGIPYEPMQPARQESRPAPAAQQQPAGSFGAMNDFADLLDQERQDVTRRRAGIAERQGQRRAFDLAEADRRTAESMQREAQARRRAVLDAVLADPETKNPTGRFAATLRREGYRDSTPTEDELRTIQRFEDVRAAKPAPPEVEPSAPNELDPAAVGIRERRAPAPPKNLREGMARAQAARAAEGGSMPQAAQPTTAPSFDPGKAWASLDTKQRADLAGRLQGVPQIVSKNVPRAEWEKINPALRGKLAEAMAPRAAAPIEGADLGDGWAAFRPESGTVGVPRAEMPQIKAEHRGAMVNFMNARGVQHQEETVPASSLKPTQAEFSREKVARAKSFDGGGRSILASSDNHVLDGHHQWMASRDKGEDVKVIRLDAPIRELVSLAREFPSSTTVSGSDAAQGDKNGQRIEQQAGSEMAPQGGAQGRADVDGGAGDLVQRPDGAAGAGMGAASAGPVRGGAPVEPAGTAGDGRGAVGQALQILMDRTDGIGAPDGLSGPEHADARTAIVSALTGESVADIEAAPNFKFRTSVPQVERLLYDAAGIPAGKTLGDRRTPFMNWLDQRESGGALASTELSSRADALDREMARKLQEADGGDVMSAAANQAPIKSETRIDAELTSKAAPSDQEAIKKPTSDSSLFRDSSWVIKNKDTGEIVMETFDRAKVDALNTSKYEAVPILEHLQSLNKKEPGAAEQPAVGNAPSPLEALFSDLNSDSTRKANKAKKAAAKLPEAARIEYVQANFHDILMQMMEAGALEVNGFATLTEDNAPCL